MNVTENSGKSLKEISKNWESFGEDFFLRSPDSICLKIDQNLGQDRLLLFPASKTAPPCKFMATHLQPIF